ncbi:hypothetical protein MK079_03330, partial [Candidatus Gracilibacteria bacterium]|nr:hypothetical protein [Candidatus Gracilibacteria bacterium]
IDSVGGISFLNDTEYVTGEFFSPLISTIVEAKITRSGSLGTPKQILFDFQKEFFDTLIEEQNYGSYAKIFLEHILSRDILFFSFFDDEKEILRGLGLSGYQDYSQTLDFSYPVFTSLSGNKSDRYIDTHYSKEVSYGENCSIETKFNITRKHLFNKKNEAEILDIFNRYDIQNRSELLQIQGKGQNHQYIRLLLPKNAQITPQDGMILTQHTYFQELSWYTRTEVSETTTDTIEYTLLNPLCEKYSYVHYKQPGIREYHFDITTPEYQKEFVGIRKNFIYNQRDL